MRQRANLPRLLSSPSSSLFGQSQRNRRVNALSLQGGVFPEGLRLDKEKANSWRFSDLLLLFVQILSGNIILEHFMSNHFVLVRPIGVFHSFNHFRFERVSFFEQLLDAFRTCTLDPG